MLSGVGLADAADQVVLVEQLDHLLDRGHRVGRVRVHDHDVLALGLGDPGADRDALAAVGGVPASAGPG